MEKSRKELYEQLETQRASKVISYFTSTRQGMETIIAQDTVNLFTEQLDAIGPVKRISLFLYTTGGSTSAAWNIVNLIQMFCDELEIIVPSLARSAGTLICLGASKIIMTKQATLGPIDPSVNTPLNPLIPNAGQNAKVPVSVEAIKGYIELAQKEMGVKDGIGLANILIKLSESVHPLVLGEAMRSRSQIKMLAEKLLRTQITNKKIIKKIIAFLCSESGSHDYTINRREALGLGLNVIKPSPTEYQIIKNLYTDISNEMQMSIPFDLKTLLGVSNATTYSNKRAIIESIYGGSDYFISEGQLTKVMVNQGAGQIQQIAINDQRTFEGWRHFNDSI